MFFTALSMAFCIALWLRIRAYSNETGAQQTGQAQAQAQGQPGDQPRRSSLRSVDATSAPGVRSSAEETSTRTVEETASTRKSRRSESSTEEAWQLIASAPRPAVPKAAIPPEHPAAEKPSLLSRLVNPIVNAITGGSSKSQTVPSSSSNQMPPGQGSGSSPPGKNAADTVPPKTDTNDPTSDTHPPRLVSVIFTPQQIHDGEETVLTVQASDDLSGVRSISGTVAAPGNAAVLGFACQQEFGTDRYVGHITVPKQAAEGMWHISYLSLIDNASNATTISGAQGALPPTASFRVISSASDEHGPELKAVWLDRLAMRAGEKNRVFVTADDDKSGVSSVTVTFLSPAKIARISSACLSSTGTYECEMSAPVCLDCGDWQLDTIQMQDKAGNFSTFRADNPLIANVRVNISSDQCDSTPPTLQMVTLDPTVVTNDGRGKIRVTGSANDNLCGVGTVYGQAIGPASAGSRPPWITIQNVTIDGQMWSGDLMVPLYGAKGIWRLTISVLDKGNNLRSYPPGDPALGNATFQVR